MQGSHEAAGNRVLGLSPGDVIGGRYEVVRVLGVGGTGAVFEARHRTIGRTVAVKLLLPELAGSPAVPQRFLQEARTANAVRHRNIVEVLDFGSDDGRLYMVMEFLHGESLADFIRREAPVAPGRIIRLLEPVISALATAHAAGIIHRDVKPQNVFLARSEGDDEVVPKLIDFGIAKRIAGDDTRLTATGMILGTPAYMAPEQARGERSVTHAVDQYALGVMLYQALTGRIPYEADTYPAMLIAIVSLAPTDIAKHRPDLDPGLCAAVMRTLARDPAQRFATLAALRDALRPWRDAEGPGAARTPSMLPEVAAPTRPDGSPGGGGTPASPPAPVAPTPAPPPYPPVDPLLMVDPPTVARRAPARLQRVAAVVGLMALSMVSLAAWLALRSPTRAAPQPRAAADAGGPAQGDTVTLRVDVDPSGAAIVLDGTVVGHGHAELLRPRDGRRLQLRLTAPGYSDVTDVLVASSDARVSRVLLPSAAPAPPQPTVAVVRRTAQGPDTPPPLPTQPPDERPREPARHDPNHPRIDRTDPFR